MAMNLADPAAQTFEFPGGAVNVTNSIYVSGLYEIVGFFIAQLAANTAKLRLRASEDDLSTIDASATFTDALDKDYAVTEITATGTEMADGATMVRLLPEEFIIGPIRIQLEAYQSDGSTGVNQSADTITPIFRRM